MLDVSQVPVAEGTTLSGISAVPASLGCLSPGGDVVHGSGPGAFWFAWARRDIGVRPFPTLFLAVQGLGDSHDSGLCH